MISFSSGFNGLKIFVAISVGLSLYSINGSPTSYIGPLASNYVSITIDRQRFFSNQPLYGGNFMAGQGIHGLSLVFSHYFIS